MTKEQARKAIQNRGYKVIFDMSSQVYLAYPKAPGFYVKRADTLNGLLKKVK